MNRTPEDDSTPEGFILQPGRGAFSTHNGPYYHRPSAEGSIQAFRALERHCNGVGIVHGGMLSAFLDGLLAAAAAHGTQATPITVHLSIDYLDMGRSGDWVIGEAHLTRATRDIAFAEGALIVAGRPIARATGVFKLMRRRPL